MPIVHTCSVALVQSAGFSSREPELLCDSMLSSIRQFEEYQNHILCLHSSCKSGTTMWMKEKWWNSADDFHNITLVEFWGFSSLFFLPSFLLHHHHPAHARIRGGIWVQIQEKSRKKIDLLVNIFTSVDVRRRDLKNFFCVSWADAPFLNTQQSE